MYVCTYCVYIYIYITRYTYYIYIYYIYVSVCDICCSVSFQASGAYGSKKHGKAKGEGKDFAKGERKDSPKGERETKGDRETKDFAKAKGV